MNQPLIHINDYIESEVLPVIHSLNPVLQPLLEGGVEFLGSSRDHDWVLTGSLANFGFPGVNLNYFCYDHQNPCSTSLTLCLYKGKDVGLWCRDQELWVNVAGIREGNRVISDNYRTIVINGRPSLKKNCHSDVALPEYTVSTVLNLAGGYVPNPGETNLIAASQVSDTRCSGPLGDLAMDLLALDVIPSDHVHSKEFMEVQLVSRNMGSCHEFPYVNYYLEYVPYYGGDMVSILLFGVQQNP